MKWGVIGRLVTLKRDIRTEARTWKAGTTMRVLGRMANGTYFLARPNVKLEGPSAVFGEVHGVPRSAIVVKEAA